MNPPPFNLQAVEQDTVIAVQAGRPVLQTHYYGETDAEHVEHLLAWMQPPVGATVIDAGSGIGEVSRLMADMRPDLGFLLINVSPMQLALGPSEDGERFCSLHADCHDLRGSVPDGFAQAIMYSSALCQMDAPVALAEAHRVLAQGGVLLINDLARIEGHSPQLEEMLAARVTHPDELVETVKQAGFEIDFVLHPQGSDAHFRSMLSQAGCEHVIDGIFPIVIRAIKRGEL